MLHKASVPFYANLSTNIKNLEILDQIISKKHQFIIKLDFFFLVVPLQEKFPAFICHPSRQKCIHLQTGGGGG